MLQGNGAVSVGFEERGSSYQSHKNSKAGKLELNWIPAPRVYHTSNFRDAAMRTTLACNLGKQKIWACSSMALFLLHPLLHDDHGARLGRLHA